MGWQVYQNIKDSCDRQKDYSVKYRMRYMIPEYKHSEYGKIFGDLMDLSEATAHSIHPIGQYGGYSVFVSL